MNSTVPPPQQKKPDPLVGTVVNGKFKIASLVASGGMGKIYRAEQIALQRIVALKVLHAQTSAAAASSDDPQFKKRFFREASILAKLQHPNIVTVFDYGTIEGMEEERCFMAMEFLSGQTLARRISEHTAMTAMETIKTARQIARGLTEAHANGVIHRDLKPSNVMIVAGRDGEDQVKIVDFGIVKIVGDDSNEELTQEGSFIGSPKYMAPEQITRGGKIDARTDIYSFGIILYQCLTGSVPFDGASSIQTLMAHLNQAPQSMRDRAPQSDIPDWLDMLVMSCIEKEPEKRPQTMDVVARALAEAEAAFTSSRLVQSLSNPTSSGSTPAVLGASRSGSFPDLSKMGRPSGITEQGTISSVRPHDAESDKTRTSPGMKKEAPPRSRAVPALVGAAVAVILVVGFFALRRSPATSDAANVVPPGASSAPAPKHDFALTIESSPSGADVREGDRVLGQTPLHLTIDNDGARLEPRRFFVVKDGFAQYTLEQGPSDESVRLVATLVASPPLVPVASASAPTVAPPARGGSKRAPPAQTPHGAQPQTPPPASTSGLDIRLSR